MKNKKIEKYSQKLLFDPVEFELPKLEDIQSVFNTEISSHNSQKIIDPEKNDKEKF